MGEPAKVVHRAKRFHVEEVLETRRDGSLAPRQVIRHPGAVAIVPVLDDGSICLIRNRRISVERELIELPAGTREPGEAPAVTAHRELIEETGYQAENMAPLRECLLSPGIMDERMFIFVASGLTPGEQALEAGEFIENLVVSYDEALQMCRDGRIEDAKTLVGLLTYAQQKG